MNTTELPITLSDLNLKTRDWLLAKSTRMGVSPQEALAQVMDELANKELATPTLAASPSQPADKGGES